MRRHRENYLQITIREDERDILRFHCVESLENKIIPD